MNEKILLPDSHLKRIVGIVLLAGLAKVNWEFSKNEKKMREIKKVDTETSLYSHKGGG